MESKPETRLTAGIGQLGFLLIAWVFVGMFFNNIQGLGPNARGFPTLMIWILGTLLLIGTVREVRKLLATLREARDDDAFQPSIPRELKSQLHVAYKPILALATFALYIFSVPRLGFFTATAIMLAGLMSFLGIRRPIRLLLITVGTLVAAHLMFIELFGLRLPRGIFM